MQNTDRLVLPPLGGQRHFAQRAKRKHVAKARVSPTGPVPVVHGFGD